MKKFRLMEEVRVESQFGGADPVNGMVGVIVNVGHQKRKADPGVVVRFAAPIFPNNPDRFEGWFRPSELNGTGCQGKVERGYLVDVAHMGATDTLGLRQAVLAYHRRVDSYPAGTLEEMVNLWAEGRTFLAKRSVDGTLVIWYPNLGDTLPEARVGAQWEKTWIDGLVELLQLDDPDADWSDAARWVLGQIAGGVLPENGKWRLG